MNQTFRNVSFTCFWIWVALAVTLALVPPSVAPPLPHDKLMHFAGFLGLTILGLVQATRKVPLVLALALAGGALEMIQALPSIGREAALLDLCANILGISVGLMLFGPAGRVMDRGIAGISASRSIASAAIGAAGDRQLL